MGRWLVAAAAAFIAATTPGFASAEAAQEASKPFDAALAWAEFEQLLRDKYAYIERSDIDVDAQLAFSRRLAEYAGDRAAFRRISHRTALTFMDPHLLVGPFAEDDYAIVMTAADLDARFTHGRAVIADVRRGTPAFEAGVRTGDVLLEIDGVPPEEASLLPFGDVLPEPTAAQRDYGLTLAVNGKRSGPRSLRLIRPAGGEYAVRLDSTRDWAKGLSEQRTVDLRMVGKDSEIALITPLNSLGNNATITAFDRAMREAVGARAIILDMRETPSGGNTEVARSIIGHFVAGVRPYQMHRIPAFEREFTVPRQFVEYVFPREPRFSGPVIVLHGRWTGSMGEGIVIGMDAATDATTIGSNMGDLLGGLWNFDLEESGVRVDLGGEALFHIDGTAREDYVADIVLSPASTAPDGSDPALALALETLGDVPNAN